MRKLLFVIAVVFTASLGAGAGPVPEKLTPETYEAIKARAALSQEDLAWQQAPWRVGFFEGLKEAQAADKPIFFWFYGGGSSGLASNC